jgi:hypothetical protein
MSYAFHVTLFCLCWNPLVYCLSYFIPKISFHMLNMACALRQFAFCVTDCTDQVTPEAVCRQLWCVASRPQFLGPQHCLQPLFLRCSCDLLQGDLGQYSAERPNLRHSTSCVDKINSSLLCCFQTASGVHPASSPVGTRNLFLGGKGKRLWS